MAVLANPDRAALDQAFQSGVSARRELFGALTKSDVRTAINAVDDWVDANAASFNSAIPQPARAQLTARQKAELLMAVVRRRFEVS